MSKDEELAGLREDVAELTAAVSENEPKIQALVAAARVMLDAVEQADDDGELALNIDLEMMDNLRCALVPFEPREVKP